jgi:hypothetical protein
LTKVERTGSPEVAQKERDMDEVDSLIEEEFVSAPEEIPEEPALVEPAEQREPVSEKQSVQQTTEIHIQGPVASAEASAEKPTPPHDKQALN